MFSSMGLNDLREKTSPIDSADAGTRGGGIDMQNHWGHRQTCLS